MVDNHMAVLIYDKVIVRTATRSTLIMATNLIQILNFKANFHKEIEILKKVIYADNGGHFKIVGIIKKNCPHKTI